MRGYYSESTWNHLQEALNSGREMLETKAATQTDADAAALAIVTAIDALESEYQFTRSFPVYRGSGSLTGIVDAPAEKFEALVIAGKELDQDDYSTGTGSTVITISESYLTTLPNGTHTVTAKFSDGAATTTLEIKRADTGTCNITDSNGSSANGKPTDDKPSGIKNSSPSTGDTAHPWIWMTVLILSVCCITLLRRIRKKQ